LALLDFTALAFIASLVLTFVLTPLLIRSALGKNITDRDSNKPGKPVVAAMGGFAIFGGVAGGTLIALLAINFYDHQFQFATMLLAALLSISIVALIGVFDDLFKLTRRTKVLLPVIASLPLVAVLAGDTTMSLPLVGVVDLGLFYTFVLIPVGVTGAANAVNMSAGYNGLEAGEGAVISAFLLVIALWSGSVAASVLLAALLGACLAFLKFNWFPAKVFPGDIGTYVIGGAIAAAVIVGNMEKFGLILFIPAFYELFATAYYSARGIERRKYCHNPILEGGKIIPPKGAEYFTLAYFILSRKPLTEARLVLTILLLYAACGCVALALFFAGS
jgi:UDP-N-acetylglucosamine--dolichyl-phosphate N-acetylglucosaminephosphotransferase